METISILKSIRELREEFSGELSEYQKFILQNKLNDFSDKTGYSIYPELITMDQDIYNAILKGNSVWEYIVNNSGII